MVHKFAALLPLIFLPLLANAAHGQKPSSPPTNAIFTYSPLFGGPLTVRAAWSWPVNWNDAGGTGTRSYITKAIVSSTKEVVYSGTAPDGPILPAIQFDVPYPATKYTFLVYAVNKYGLVSKPDTYSVFVP